MACPATPDLVYGLLHYRQYGLGLPGEEDDRGLLRLWVDAICINQRDTAERSQQVSFMGEILKDALYVLTWLGLLLGDFMLETSLRLMRNLSRALSGDLKQGLMERLENGRETDYGADAIYNFDRYDNGHRSSMWPLNLGSGLFLRLNSFDKATSGYTSTQSSVTEED